MKYLCKLVWGIIITLGFATTLYAGTVIVIASGAFAESSTPEEFDQQEIKVVPECDCYSGYEECD